MPKKNAHKVLMIILDGFALNPLPDGNAVHHAKKPTLDYFYKHYPYAVLEASSLAVGLPWGEVGNSEVGHTNLGSGVVLYQNLPRISVAIENKSFFEKEALVNAVNLAKERGSRIHLMGLTSNGGVHAHIEHLHALLYMMKEKKVKDVFVHAFLDGRDTAPDVGVNFIETLQEAMRTNKIGQLASMIGRFYSMDRNNKWDRTQKAYDLMVKGEGKAATDAISAIKEYYEQEIFDEMMEPIVMTDKSGNPIGSVQENDIVIFFNFRPDRARQITKAYTLEDFSDFERGDKIKNLHFVCMMEYAPDLPVELVFAPKKIETPIGKIISEHGLNQLRTAETEKYAHVTYFFNGGKDQPYENEKHILVPSPDVKSYDTVPVMSADKVTEKVLKELKKETHDFVLINYANPDMVGHTGNFRACVEAIEHIDGYLKQIYDIWVQEQGNVMVVTADHGNCDVMIDPISSRINKEHTTNPVPFFIVDKAKKREKTEEEVFMQRSLMTPIGILADVGPTVLDIMGLPKDDAMTGRSLLNDTL